jgi:hypothetical protein
MLKLDNDQAKLGYTFMHRYKIFSYSLLVAAAILIIAAFSSMPLSLDLYQEPNHVYASNLSCVQIPDLMRCEEQQNEPRSSDGGGSGVVVEDEVDGSASTSNKEDDEIPLIIPNISPTLDENENYGDDVDESSGQKNPEDGDNGANSGEGNDRTSNVKDNNDDLERSVPSVLPFP